LTINVTQIYVSRIYFILKQGYMFRLEVSHLQAFTTFSLPDALPTLGKASGNTQNCLYQINKTEVPQHQPQYDNGTHSWISGEHQRNVKEEFLIVLMFRHNL